MSSSTCLTPEAYEQAVETQLHSRFGLSVSDVGEDSVAGCRRDNWTPLECVEWLETKYDLERIDIGPYGGIKCVRE